MKSLNRFVQFVLTLLLLGLAIIPAANGQNQASGGDTVMDAMSDELNRSMSELRLKDLEKPYFVQYVVVDEEEYTGQATFGALTSWECVRQRVLQVQVRVGSYQLDSSEFITGRGESSNTQLVQTVVDNDYRALRHSLWLATDAAYKQSAEMLARKRAFLQNKVQDDQTPDFSQEKPVQAIKARETLQFNTAEMQQRLRDWSRLFQSYPEIQKSRIGLVLRLTHRYIVNSEGTRVLQPSRLLIVEAEASTQAADGMQIGQSVPFYARSFDTLPSSRQIETSIRDMAEKLKQIQTAPLLKEDYSGPVLLTGTASPDFFARILASSLTGQRGPMTDRVQQAVRTSDLLDRMNRPILPVYISVYDDPALQRLGNETLIGTYDIDDQGVPAQRVSLVESGILTDFLMARRPIPGHLQSNGHGRSGFPGRETATISNFVITAEKGKNYRDLKLELIRLCREERLSYGILIKALGPVSGGILPFLVYRVNVSDGSEELIRGVSPAGFAVRSLRHIQAAGDEIVVANRLTGTAGAETPVSVAAPAVLLEEMELKRFSGAQQRPSILSRPQQ
jgi:predicted Zn-dependent protease